MAATIAAAAGTETSLPTATAATEALTLLHEHPMATETKVRTQEVAVSDVRFGVLYGELNETFWRRFDIALNLVGALGGTSVMSGLMTSNAVVSAIAGGLITLASVLQLVLRPSEQARAFRDGRMAFLDLHSRAWSLSVQEIDAAINKIEREAPVGWRSLGPVALNCVHMETGDADKVQRLSLVQRLAAAVT